MAWCTLAARCFALLCCSYAMMGVPIPKLPGKRVLLMLRGDPPKRRSIVNLDAMLAVLNGYGMQYTYVAHRANIKELTVCRVRASRCGCICAASLACCHVLQDRQGHPRCNLSGPV